MVQVQRTSLWLAALFACAGTAFIAVYLMTRRPEAYLLFGAAVAAVFSAAALLAGVVFVCLESAWRMRPRAPRILPPQPDPVVVSASAAVLSEQFEQRREVLSERLNIDEPHFCSQSQTPCTAWSFCGSGPQAQPVTFAADREGQGSPCPEAAANEQPLPVVLRSGPLISCLAMAPAASGGKPLPRTDEQQVKSA